MNKNSDPDAELGRLFEGYLTHTNSSTVSPESVGTGNAFLSFAPVASTGYLSDFGIAYVE